MDIYYTISKTGSFQYKEKMSRFLAYAEHVGSADEAKARIKWYQNEYHDSRHVCWAYMIGPDRKEWQFNDNGEPSGTAGKPILGQINSAGLTDVLVVVVRYFGGIKLGTSGLIAAYREAARGAIADGGTLELRQQKRFRIIFPYEGADGIMRVVKNDDIKVLSREFDNMCSIEIEFPLDMEGEIRGKIGKVASSRIEEK